MGKKGRGPGRHERVTIVLFACLLAPAVAFWAPAGIAPPLRIAKAKSSPRPTRHALKICMRSVCVVGSINHDQTVYAPAMPVPGQTVYGTSYETGFGGKGANQCAMAALMGAETTMVGKLGSDGIASITRAHMESMGIRTDFIGNTADAASGVAAITCSADGQNVIIVVPGANHLLTEQDISAAQDVIEGCKVLLCQNEIAPKTTLCAMRAAKGKGPLVILNAAPAPSEGGKWREGQWESFKEMLTACDVLCVNDSETEALTGISIKSGDEQQATLLAAASKLNEMGCARILFTLGAQGSCHVEQKAGGAEITYAKAGSVEKALDTTGAGDAFLGALAAYLANGLSLKDAMTRAGRVASITVEAKGAQSSYPKSQDLPADLRL